MAFIKRNSIPLKHEVNMYAESGFRERAIMRNATHVFTSNRGRCIEFLDKRTGQRCQYDKRTGHWTN